MALPTAAPLLECSVVPNKVPCSAGEDERSIVSLTITVANKSSDAVDCSRLEILVPSASIPTSRTLTTDPTTFAVDVGDVTPWAIFTSGNGTCYAVPLPPAVGIPAGSSAEFTIACIVVNTVPGTVDISISLAEDPPIIVPITKVRPAEAQSAAPQIVHFDVWPKRVALGAEVKIDWEVSGAQSCTLAPGPIVLPSPVSGTVRLPVLQTTDFTIRAFSAGGTAGLTKTVTVSPVEIDEFISLPAGAVAPGQVVTLRWRTRFASSRSIDHGIGAVSAAGSTTVTVSATTVYTLVAAGLYQKERSLTVKVGA